jgi:hypothetical protein
MHRAHALPERLRWTEEPRALVLIAVACGQAGKAFENVRDG